MMMMMIFYYQFTKDASDETTLLKLRRRKSNVIKIAFEISNNNNLLFKAKNTSFMYVNHHLHFDRNLISLNLVRYKSEKFLSR